MATFIAIDVALARISPYSHKSREHQIAEQRITLRGIEREREKATKKRENETLAQLF